MPIDKSKKVTTSITLSNEVMHELNEISDFTGISRSKLIEISISCQPCYNGLKQGVKQMKERKSR